MVQIYIGFQQRILHLSHNSNIITDLCWCLESRRVSYLRIVIFPLIILILILSYVTCYETIFCINDYWGFRLMVLFYRWLVIHHCKPIFLHICFIYSLAQLETYRKSCLMNGLGKYLDILFWASLISLPYIFRINCHPKITLGHLQTSDPRHSLGKTRWLRLKLSIAFLKNYNNRRLRTKKCGH